MKDVSISFSYFVYAVVNLFSFANGLSMMSFFRCHSLFTEQAAGVYHRESRKGRYQLTYKEAKAVCKYEGGNLATYKQLEAARQIGLTHTHI